MNKQMNKKFPIFAVLSKVKTKKIYWCVFLYQLLKRELLHELVD